MLLLKKKSESKDESEPVLGQTKITIFINKSKIYINFREKKKRKQGRIKERKKECHQ